MRQRQQRPARGQSIVEMAMILPFLLIVIFAIIDFGYIIYSYATIYQSARNAAEVAAQAPPYPARVSNESDDRHPYGSEYCIDAILNAAQEDAVMFPDLSEHVFINYPPYQLETRSWAAGAGTPLPATERRRIGYPIEVSITYDVEMLTPLAQLIPIVNNQRPASANNPVFTISTTARRSIEALALDPNDENRSVCEP